MLIASKNEEAEILTVKLQLKDKKLRIINGYRPHDDDLQQNRLNFWLGLEEEIISAKSESCMIIIQMDANAKVGQQIISRDPNNVTDSNGRHLLELLDRQGLKMLNADKRCVGAITRYRMTKNKTEVAILDYVLVCQEMSLYLESMTIDEERKLTLTKYASTKGVKQKIGSDHNPIHCKFSIFYDKKTSGLKRKELFNLKNGQCQAKFFEATNEGSQFQNCFEGNRDFESKSNKFFKTLDDKLHKCFSKIRIKSGGRKNEVSSLIEQKTKLSLSLPSLTCKLGKEIVLAEIMKIEDDISSLSASRNAELCQAQGVPPTAKQDKNGALITSPNLLKKLYLDTYSDRLKNRDIKTELQDLYFLKSELWESRLEELRETKSRKWTVEDLEIVLKKLKKNKSRDPHGLINEIFKPGIIGNDLKLGMVDLFNEIKTTLHIPKMLQYANITTIWKKKGSRQNLENDPGIFVVSVLRMILDSLIYQDKYEELDKNMSDSNIGARKQRNVRDHLFLVYGIVNSILNGEGPPMDIQIYDVEKCFDALWLEDCMLDMFETLPPDARDDKIALIYQLNKENHVAVNTAVGITERVMLPKVVMQGGKWGPLKCSNTMDQIGKECAKKGEHL